MHIYSYRVLKDCVISLVDYYTKTVECVATGSEPRGKDKPVGRQETVRVHIARPLKKDLVTGMWKIQHKS